MKTALNLVTWTALEGVFGQVLEKRKTKMLGRIFLRIQLMAREVNLLQKAANHISGSQTKYQLDPGPVIFM